MSKLVYTTAVLAALSLPVFADTRLLQQMPGESFTVTDWYKQNVCPVMARGCPLSAASSVVEVAALSISGRSAASAASTCFWASNCRASADRIERRNCPDRRISMWNAS